ncbi:putative polypeptide N-acetylgalactosaminyltransferase 10 isoform X1 [Bacillus rossius redtenbacheri]|uniref:putative polypeptide N-acetylgalactosaminyltransferase 10 isoform X1 n=2 Tax=Bacillus rossius redtenbacheri TaxID=93214 RepID=UPI002FDE85F2
MRRSIKSVLKFLLLAAVTVLTTVVVFRYVRRVETMSAGGDLVVEAHGAMPLPPQPPGGAREKTEFVVRDVGKAPAKIDWHDYAAIERDARRKGKGEQGKPAYLTPDDTPEKEALYKVNGFNALLSDQISLNRSLPDIRHKGCKAKKYAPKMPSVSVIVPFHNEHWSTLLRTAVSVINRSHSSLLLEVILVDDASTKEHCKKPLDEYVSKNLPKVKVIHLPERSGLIRARLAGAKQAVGEVLIFLDSHTEANVNWLPPLLDPIAEDYRTCVCPFIDVVAYETFEYRAQDEGARGAFDWEFFYKRLPLLPSDLENPTEPFKSPVMAGGLFAISAKFFWELGGYDVGLEIWGGEQYELSFKIWQCGGQMVDAPCSRVGHIYRKFAPFPNPGKGDFVGRNYRRVAEVWMDEYKEYLYMRRPHYRSIDPGDLTQQRALREKLQCKPFKWFMENVAFDLPKKYPPIEPPDFASGEIRSVAAPELCVDTEHKPADQQFGLKPCLADKKGGSGEQEFVLTWHKDVRPKGRTMCWDVASVQDKAPVTLFSCHGMQGNQLWRYNPDHQWLVHGGNPRCLDCDPGRQTIFVTTCDPTSQTQRWRFEHVDLKALADWDHVGPK